MPPGQNFARRGGKVHNSQRITLSPTSLPLQRKGVGRGKKVLPSRRRLFAPKDTIFGITKGDIRRLARRGGVKRISAQVYDTTRIAMRQFLEDVLPLASPWSLTTRSLRIVRYLWNMDVGKLSWWLTLSTRWGGKEGLFTVLNPRHRISPGNRSFGMPLFWSVKLIGMYFVYIWVLGGVFMGFCIL